MDKNIIFPVQAEYLYFSAEFRLKYSCDMRFLNCKNTTWSAGADINGVKVTLEPHCRQ